MTATPAKLTLPEVTAMGIGGMIGGGIFAVLGLAISVAGHAVALTLSLGGVIALLTGLSYARLGVAFRGDGGTFTYVQKAFAHPAVSAVLGWLLVGGYVGTLALYATAFGAYGAKLLGVPDWSAPALASAVLVAFLGINLLGAKLSGGVELGVVAIKLGILALFAVVGLVALHPSHLVPVFDRGVVAPFAAVPLIFVAYEGFELIPNAIDEMVDPARTLGRAIVIAILATIAIYIVVAVAALGNLTPTEIVHDQEYVLAVAARPTLGQTGFVLIGIAALLSTASAINATLFGAARLAMVMAAERALPALFARKDARRGVPSIALAVLTALAVAFTLAAPLPIISTFASEAFLLIFAMVNLSAFRLARQIGLNRLIPLAGGLLSGGSFFMLLWENVV